MSPQVIIAPPDQDKTKIVRPLEIYFTKSAQFRALHAQGVWFSADPQQNLHFSFFTERAPLPDKIVVNLNSDGTVASQDEPKQIGKSGFEREIEVDVSFTIADAVAFYKAFGDNLKSIKAI